ncbi:MAG: phage tail length tape measure family protein [Patescibacteria group bacterium]|nr:phage tail length tape measure family protein [Patescibacteria group bacterium]
MSATIGSLIVDMKANTAKLDEQLKQSKSHFSSLQKTIHTVRNALVAFGAVTVLKDVLQEAAANEKAFALLKSQVMATGGAAGYSAGQLQAMAMQMEHVTTFSHTQIEQAQGELLAFTSITGAQFKKTLQVSMDFATITGRNLPDAIRTLGQAINNPVRALGRLTQAGVSLTIEQQKQIKQMALNGNLIGAQRILLDDLAKSYGGAAEAARNTLGGALAGLKNTFTDLVEGGNGSFNGATKAINQLAQTLQSPAVKAGFQAIVEGIAEIISVLAKAIAGFGELLQYVDQVAGNSQRHTLQVTVDVDMKKLKALAAKGLQNTPEYRALEAQVTNFNNRILGNTTGVDMTAGAPQSTGAKMPSHGLIPLPLVAPNTKAMNAVMKATHLKLQRVADIHPVHMPLHMKTIKVQVDQQFQQMQSDGQRVASGLQNTFQNLLFNPMHHGIRGIVRGWIVMIDQMVAKAASSRLMDALFGGGKVGTGTASAGSLFGNFFSSFLSGARAGGGPVSSGNAYLVGENGPELFSPGSSGTVIPNHALGGAAHHTSVNIDARGAGPDEVNRLLAFSNSLRMLIRKETEYRIERGTWMSLS